MDSKSRFDTLLNQLAASTDKAMMVKTVAVFENLIQKIQQLQVSNFFSFLQFYNKRHVDYIRIPFIKIQLGFRG